MQSAETDPGPIMQWLAFWTLKQTESTEMPESSNKDITTAITNTLHKFKKVVGNISRLKREIEDTRKTQIGTSRDENYI